MVPAEKFLASARREDVCYLVIDVQTDTLLILREIKASNSSVTALESVVQLKLIKKIR